MLEVEPKIHQGCDPSKSLSYLVFTKINVSIHKSLYEMKSLDMKIDASYKLKCGWKQLNVNVYLKTR